MSADQGILQLATNKAALGPHRVETLKEVEVSRCSTIKADSSTDQGILQNNYLPLIESGFRRLVFCGWLLQMKLHQDPAEWRH